MSVAVESVRGELASLLGETRVVTDPADCAAFAVDGKAPRYVVYPPSAEHVASVLGYAMSHDLAVIPSRNGTKLAIGNPPRRYDVALSLKELNRVWHFEPADLTISVEPGMKFGDFQSFVGRQGLWLPLDPRGGAKASLGGIIATNAAGPLRQGHGCPRDMVLGLKIACTDGKIVKTGGRVVKNVAGYDLGKLLIGSYGTLGVIVEAHLKLSPKPPECVTFQISPATLEKARDLRRKILRSPLDARRLALLDGAAVRIVRGRDLGSEYKPLVLWMEVGGTHRVIERCERELAKLSLEAGAPLARLEDAGQAWEQVANLALRLPKRFASLTVLKAALPIAASEEFLKLARQEAEAGRIPTATVALVGVGIVSVCLLEEKLCAVSGDLIARLRKLARGLGGSLVIEHCPLQLKEHLDVWGPPGDDLEAMRRVKSAWDPKGILAPGRLVGGI